MEKALMIEVANEKGQLSLEQYLQAIPLTVRQRIKPSFLHDRRMAPLGTHAIIPLRLLTSTIGLLDSLCIREVERFAGGWNGKTVQTREEAIESLPALFAKGGCGYSWYASQGFGYRELTPAELEPVTQPEYTPEDAEFRKYNYLSIVLPEDRPGYIEHWITCKRRAQNMLGRGEIKGILCSKIKGLAKLHEHNRKFGSHD